MTQNNPFDLFPDTDDDSVFIDVEDFGFQSFEDEDVEPEPEKPHSIVPPKEEKTNAQLVDELFKSMKPQKKILKGIIIYCQEQKSVAEVEAEMNRIAEDNRSVYEPALLCSILERNKAFVRVYEDGMPVDLVDDEPEIMVDEDGNEYYATSEPKEYFFRSTVEALEWVLADDPKARIMERIGDEERFKPIYKYILTKCAQEGGVKMRDLDHELFAAKLLRDENYFPQRFIDKLEDCESVEWKKTWQITEIGREVLEALSDASDELEYVEVKLED